MPFKPGQSGNLNGRPKKTVEEKYRQLLVSQVKPEAWARIVEKAVEDAEAGDGVARKWLGDQLLGLPVQRNELTGANGGGVTINIVHKSRKREDDDGIHSPAA